GGAGGKTLALSAAMAGRGQIYATDSDKRGLAPIHARIERAGAHDIQVRTPKRPFDPAGGEVADLAGRADLVLIDAPCTGTGAWRRNPDAKWRGRARGRAAPPQGNSRPPPAPPRRAGPGGPRRPPPPCGAGGA